MTLFHENRLDNTVDVGSIGVGETVEVRTLMGIPKACGEVVGSTPMGLIVREEGCQDTFYRENIHLFATIEPDVVTRIGNVLTDMDPDQKVEIKLRSLGEKDNKDDDLTGGGAKEIDKDYERGDDDDSEKDDKDDDDKDSKDKSKEKKKDDDEPDEKDSVVDPDELPDDIKNAIISTEQMDEAQLNSVLGEVSESAVKALKRAGVKETEILVTAQKIQNAVYKILTGKKRGK